MSKELSNNQILVREYVKQDFKESQSNERESDHFEFFAASQVLREYDISDDEIEKGRLGSGNDGGCDGIYLFLNGVLLTEDSVECLSTLRDAKLEFVIIQAKNVTSFGEDAIMKWKTTADNLLKFDVQLDSYSKRYNEDVLLAFQLFKDAHIKLIRSKLKLHFKFLYVSIAAEVHLNVKAQLEELRAIIKKMFPSSNTSVEIYFIGADTLMKHIYTEKEHSCNISLAEAPITIGKRKDYVALVNIREFFSFISDNNGELKRGIFEANVRDYQGHTSVNVEIQETLSNAAYEDFWWLNNGITILASDATLVTGKIINISDPEIVNGLQTSTEIFNYFSNHKKKLDEEQRNLLVRIIVPESEETRDKIILATNSQTNIPKSSLRVTDPIHRQIEMYFKARGLYYDRRKNHYRNQGKKASDIISVSFLGQCLISLLLQKPDSARARPSTLLNNDEHYNEMYVKNSNLEVFYKSAMLGKRIEKYIKALDACSSTAKSDILFYVLFYYVADTIGSSNITVEDVRNFSTANISEALLRQAVDKVHGKYVELGGTSSVAKGSQLIVALKEELIKN